jgi:hypothetical protein
MEFSGMKTDDRPFLTRNIAPHLQRLSLPSSGTLLIFPQMQNTFIIYLLESYTPNIPGE